MVPRRLMRIEGWCRESDPALAEVIQCPKPAAEPCSGLGVQPGCDWVPMQEAPGNPSVVSGPHYGTYSVSRFVMEFGPPAPLKPEAQPNQGQNAKNFLPLCQRGHALKPKHPACVLVLRHTGCTWSRVQVPWCCVLGPTHRLVLTCDTFAHLTCRGLDAATATVNLTVKRVAPYTAGPGTTLPRDVPPYISCENIAQGGRQPKPSNGGRGS